MGKGQRGPHPNPTHTAEAWRRLPAAPLPRLCTCRADGVQEGLFSRTGRRRKEAGRGEWEDSDLRPLPGVGLDSGSHSSDSLLPGKGWAKAEAVGGNPETPLGPREGDRLRTWKNTLSL